MEQRTRDWVRAGVVGVVLLSLAAGAHAQGDAAGGARAEASADGVGPNETSTAETSTDETGAQGRVELAALVERAFGEQRAHKSVELAPNERVFGLPFEAVEATGIRVVGTVGREECARVARALVAARALFIELTGATEAAYPRGLTAYLLGTDEAKEQFLTKHSAIGPEARARLAKLHGTGIPGTADWAWWEGDDERRLDGMVRIGLGWLCDTQRITIERHAWLHEGLGFYLTHALTGTYLTWFVPIRTMRDAADSSLQAQMGDPGVDWGELAGGLFAPDRAFDLEELLHLQAYELSPSDHLRAHALAAYIAEVQRTSIGPILQRLAGEEDARVVLEETLGVPFAELRPRLHAWLAARDALIARAEGRRPEAELAAQWEGLTPFQRRGAVTALERRVEALDTQQLRWLRAAHGRSMREPGPAAEAPFYDPKVHAPAQPIPRKRLPPTDSRVKRLLKEVRKPPPAGALKLAYDYDWGTGLVVRVGADDDPEAVFQNALLGVPPHTDLARALALQAMDRADERKMQAAFAHAYTDREGNVFPVTLYDALNTGSTIEMPDVDSLGVVHDILDEWKRWVAPVPGNRHDELYTVIGDLFLVAKHSRELRLALADLFLFHKAPPFPGYETQTLNLQALWAESESDPERLAAALPDGKSWEAFLTANTARCRKDGKFFSGGRRRAAILRKDARELHKALGAALDEAALMPREEPVPETPETTDKPGKPGKADKKH